MGILSTNFDATICTGDYIFYIAQVLRKMSEDKPVESHQEGNTEHFSFD